MWKSAEKDVKSWSFWKTSKIKNDTKTANLNAKNFIWNNCQRAAALTLSPFFIRLFPPGKPGIPGVSVFWLQTDAGESQIWPRCFPVWILSASLLTPWICGTDPFPLEALKLCSICSLIQRDYRRRPSDLSDHRGPDLWLDRQPTQEPDI